MEIECPNCGAKLTDDVDVRAIDECPRCGTPIWDGYDAEALAELDGGVYVDVRGATV